MGNNLATWQHEGFFFSSSRKRIYIYQIAIVLVRSVSIDRIFLCCIMYYYFDFCCFIPRIEHSENGVGCLEGGMM